MDPGDERLASIDVGFDGKLFIKANGKKFYITLSAAHALGKLLIHWSEDRSVRKIDEYLMQLKICEEIRKPRIIEIDESTFNLPGEK